MRSQGPEVGGRLAKSELAILVISAAVTITIVSACSPLYPFNPWDDANCFFTVGRGIIHGLVPYRDLYEQKGPLLYLFSLCSGCPDIREVIYRRMDSRMRHGILVCGVLMEDRKALYRASEVCNRSGSLVFGAYLFDQTV